MVLDLYTDFSGGRSGGLVSLDLEEFSIVLIHTVKGFGIVSKAEVDVFMELSCFFDEPTDVVNLICFLCLSKSSLNIWKLSVHALLKPGLKNFEHYFDSV